MTDTAIRLRHAREAAGYATAGDAAKAFGWPYPTYAAHENGSRGLKPDLIRRYAKAFRVSAHWLLDGAGDMRANVAPTPAPGLSEPEVEVFVPQTDQQNRVTSALVQMHSTGAGRPILYRVNANYLAYGILRGDVLLVGSPATPAALQIVVATLANETTGEGHTVLRQSASGQLIAPIGQSLDGEDSLSAGVLGSVLAVLRT